MTAPLMLPRSLGKGISYHELPQAGENGRAYGPSGGDFPGIVPLGPFPHTDGASARRQVVQSSMHRGFLQLQLEGKSWSWIDGMK